MGLLMYYFILIVIFIVYEAIAYTKLLQEQSMKFYIYIFVKQIATVRLIHT